MKLNIYINPNTEPILTQEWLSSHTEYSLIFDNKAQKIYVNGDTYSFKTLSNVDYNALVSFISNTSTSISNINDALGNINNINIPLDSGVSKDVENILNTLYNIFTQHSHNLSHSHSEYITSLSHNHTEFSTTSHAHINYATTEHEHTEYMTSLSHAHSEYSVTTHKHDEYLTSLSHSHDLSHSHTEYAGISHSHSGYLTSLVHNHTEFATTGQLAHSHSLAHNHTEYATTGQLAHSHSLAHNHTEYATTGHSHAGYLTSLVHSHSEYITSLAHSHDLSHSHTEYSGTGHTHDGRYLRLSSGTTPVNFNSSNLPQFTGNIPYLVGIEAFADGGTLKWQTVSNVKVGSASSADSVAWDNVTSKPSSFTPSSHSHSLTHAHTEYSLTSHSHSSYLTSLAHSHTEYSGTGHNHDGRYLPWGGFSAADATIASWGTLTSSNGYNPLYHVASSDGGDLTVAYKSGQIFMQLDGYFYQNEGRNRVLDTSDLAHSHSAYSTTDHSHSAYITSLAHSHDLSHSHSQYLPLGGGTMTGIINRDSGGSWISARDHVIIKTTRTSNEGNDWHPILGIKTTNGFWSMGSVGGESLSLSYDTDTNYNSNNNTSTVIKFPAAGSSGTLALTSQLSHSHSAYLTSLAHSHDLSHSHSAYLTSLAHNHTEFATTGHSHSSYLTSLAHSHSAYLTSLSHSHSDYATTSHSHSAYLTSLAHSHDFSHSHSQYLPLSGGKMTNKFISVGNSSGTTEIKPELNAITIGPSTTRGTTSNSYYPGIAFNHMINYNSGTGYDNSSQAWIGLRLHSTPGSELSYLVFATKPGTGTTETGNDIPIERMSIAPDGSVAINNSLTIGGYTAITTNTIGHSHSSYLTSLAHSHSTYLTSLAHGHTEFATTSHSHSSYLTSLAHSHSAYLTSLAHSHDFSHSHSAYLTSLAHSHSAYLTSLSHSHSDYATTSHSHSAYLTSLAHSHSGYITSLAHTHFGVVTEGDNRSVATKPNDYANSFLFKGLKNNSTIGSPSTDTYSYLLGLRGWSDSSGGKAHEIAFNDSGIYVRNGSTTSWGNWLKLSTTDQLSHSHSAYLTSLSHSHSSYLTSLAHSHSGYLTSLAHSHTEFATTGHSHSSYLTSLAHSHDFSHSHSGYLTSLSHSHSSYVLLDAGSSEQTIKNSIGSMSIGSINIWRATSGGWSMIGFSGGTTKTQWGYLGFTAQNTPVYATSAQATYNLIHAGNISNYAVTSMSHSHSAYLTSLAHSHTDYITSLSHSHSTYLTSLAHNHTGFATTSHSHTEYINSLAHSHSTYITSLSHSHSEYATTSHSHSGYLTSLTHAHTDYITSLSHSHSGYATTSHSHSGYASTSHTHNYVVGSYTANGGQQNPNYFGTNKVGFLMMNTTVNSNSQYKDWMIMDCYSGSDVGGGVAIGVNRQSLGAYIMRSAAARTSWEEKAELLGTHNYTSYCATTSHSHSGYATTGHSHSAYLTSLPDHSHSGYATTGHSHSGYSTTGHTHTFDNIGAGVATIGDGANRLMFRTNSSWLSGMYYHTTGNEAMVFGNYNSSTSWIFATTNPANRPDWTGLTPSLQIKNQCVVINKLIANGTNASYNLDVNGSANATTLYENGSRVAILSNSGDSSTTYYLMGTPSTIGNVLYRYGTSGPYMKGTELYAGSDIKLKKDVKPISNEFIEQLFDKDDITYNFKWKDNDKESNGFIAQEIEDIMPEVIDNSDDNIKHVNYDSALSKVVGALFKEMKSMKETIKNQQNEIEKLKEIINNNK